MSHHVNHPNTRTSNNNSPNSNPDRWQKLRHQMTILKQQFLNPDRHAQAAKATIVEITKAKWEESLIVKSMTSGRSKTIVTYLDK